MNIRYMKKVVNLLEEILNHQIANRHSPEAAFYRCYTYAHGRLPDWVKKAESLRKELHRNLITKRDKHGRRVYGLSRYTIRWKERGRWKYSACSFKTKYDAAHHADAIGATQGVYELIPVNRRPQK